MKFGDPRASINFWTRRALPGQPWDRLAVHGYRAPLQLTANRSIGRLKRASLSGKPPPLFVTNLARYKFLFPIHLKAARDYYDLSGSRRGGSAITVGRPSRRPRASL